MVSLAKKNQSQKKAKPQFGLGFRKSFANDVFESWPKIDFFEIISENYMGQGGLNHAHLKKLRERYPVVFHGVSLSIAAVDDPSAIYLEKLKDLISEFDPSLVTDHLCFTKSGGRDFHDLLPFPLNEKTLDLISRRIEFVQKFLGRRVGFENPSQYLAPSKETLALGAFFNKLYSRTGCGVLLDLNNLWVNEVNLGFDSTEVIEELNPKSVVQFHIAGASESSDKFLIDTHDHPMSPRAWELYSHAVSQFPNVPTLLEWDDKIPPFKELVAELAKAKKIHKKASPYVMAYKNLDSEILNQKTSLFQAARMDLLKSPESEDSGYVHELFTQEFGDCLLESEGIESSDSRLLRHFESGIFENRHWGMGVYMKAFFLRHREQMIAAFPLFSRAIGEKAFDKVLERYLLKYIPRDFSIDETGQDFEKFCKEHLEGIIEAEKWDIEYPLGLMTDLVAFEYAHYELLGRVNESRPRLSLSTLSSLGAEEWTHFEFSLGRESFLLDSQFKLSKFIESLKSDQPSGRDLSVPWTEPEVLYLTRNSENRVSFYSLTRFEEAIFRALERPQTMPSLCEGVMGKSADQLENSMKRLFEALLPWVERGLLVQNIREQQPPKPVSTGPRISE